MGRCTLLHTDLVASLKAYLVSFESALFSLTKSVKIALKYVEVLCQLVRGLTHEQKQVFTSVKVVHS